MNLLKNNFYLISNIIKRKKNLILNLKFIKLLINYLYKIQFINNIINKKKIFCPQYINNFIKYLINKNYFFPSLNMK